MGRYREAFDGLGNSLAMLNNKDCEGCHCIYSDCGNARYCCDGVSELKVLEEAVRIAENSVTLENILLEIVNIRDRYDKLKKEGFTKKKMCDLLVPFRDKYGLSDKETLFIARDEMGIEKAIKVANSLKDMLV